jgi:citrate lyase gamma subunit
MSHLHKEKPTVTAINDVVADSVETHPAYGMIGASRVTGHANLAGSDFNHQAYVVIELRSGRLYRGHSNDRWYGDKSLARVALSEAQWATFVSAMNVSFGVPCTMEYVNGVRLPGITPIIDRKKQFTSEVKQTMQDALSKMQEAHDAAPTKKLKALIANAMQEIRSNVPFVEQQFGEHMENTVEKAKIEVSAYVTGAIQRAGLDAIAAKNLIEIQDASK